MIRDESVRPKNRFQRKKEEIKYYAAPYHKEREEKYIKENSRILRFFKSLDAYYQAAEENKKSR